MASRCGPATSPVRPTTSSGPAATTPGHPQSSASGTPTNASTNFRKRKNNRGGKKKRRQSFAVISSAGAAGVKEEDLNENVEIDPFDGLTDAAQTSISGSRNAFYGDLSANNGGTGGGGRRNLSNTSIESESLLDHRDQTPFLRARRPSVVTPNISTSGVFTLAHPSPTRLRVTKATALGDSGDEDMASGNTARRRTRSSIFNEDDDDDNDNDNDGARSSFNEGAPLLSQSLHGHPEPPFRINSDGTSPPATRAAAFAGYGTPSSGNNNGRPSSHRGSSHSSQGQRFLAPFGGASERYNVNYPPSVPGSPPLRPTGHLQHHPVSRNMTFGDEMLRDELSDAGRRSRSPSPPLRRSNTSTSIRNIGRNYAESIGRGGGREGSFGASSSILLREPTGANSGGGGASETNAKLEAAQEDVCFPQEALLSEISEEEHEARQHERRNGQTNDDDGDHSVYRARPARRRRRKWPDLAILDEWSRLEKEGRGWEERRAAKTIKEPQLINGRLRPVHKGWHRAEEDAPYRFTYFNELFQSTIHCSTISELVQPGNDNGLSFHDLFVPDPPLLSDSDSDSETADEAVVDEAMGQALLDGDFGGGGGGSCGDSLRRSGTQSGETTALDIGLRMPQPSQMSTMAETLVERTSTQVPADAPTSATASLMSPSRTRSPFVASPGPIDGQGSAAAQTTSPLSPRAAAQTVPKKPKKQPRYGERPVWWLDVLSPTEAEMKILSKAFGIHPLTAEDIVMQEAREKVELFQHYYFVSYRSFDQDPQSETFLEPVNMYVVVFREGVLSFHFSMTPHPANVRRRIRQLSDYMILSSDWVGYAIIDDITDVFVPLIQNIEDEVDDIDDAILAMHSNTNEDSGRDGDKDGGKDPDGNMLRRVGDCRKRVMSLYRLLGNKADVIKGFAKRCNEYWEVAPRSEIGLYLGDIQDHIVTMTANLSHYEKILSRSHGNYLAQINIRMNERQEQTADVLGKLTVLGTIVLPMNIITGLWGMNVWVPGQEYDGDLRWFVVITFGLLVFGMACYVTAKRVYGIV